MGYKVELTLDDILAEFEVQDWIDNVFSVHFPEVKAEIKSGCSGHCADTLKKENELLREKLRKFENHNKNNCKLKHYVSENTNSYNARYNRAIICYEYYKDCSRCINVKND